MTDDSSTSFDEAFRERFRGAPEEIRRRLSVYLPLFEEAGVRGLAGPVLDLGSGRGEWLELLAEQGYAASGVDAAEPVAARAREAAVDVAHGDALEELTRRPDASLAAVTAIHVVEHVDPAALGALLVEIHRVLVAGGVLLLETPNPENVVVATSSFYLDPGHVRPVPPSLLEFHARRAGFALPWVARVNADLLGAPIPEVAGDAPGALEMNAAVQAVNRLVASAPDYALVAQKEGGEDPFVLDAEAFERLFGPQPPDPGTQRVLAAEEAARRLQAEKTAAEQLARRLEAEKLEAEARAAELERRSRAEADAAERSRRESLLAEALADAREAEARRAEARARAAEARTYEVSVQAQKAWRDLEEVAASQSWRLTAPLRAVARATHGARLAISTPIEDATPKTYAKLAVGYPMRWLLGRPGLGPALERGLARVPAVEHKVQLALHETRAVSLARRQRPDPSLPADLRDLTVRARVVVADLQRALSGGAR